VVNREGLGVPPEIFPTFFVAIRDSFRDIAGEAWTPAMESAWSDLVTYLEATATPQ
jgi:hypothetical protein